MENRIEKVKKRKRRMFETIKKQSKISVTENYFLK